MIQYYEKIAVALMETDRIMEEVDQLDFLKVQNVPNLYDNARYFSGIGIY
jgi:hypothetical protein